MKCGKIFNLVAFNKHGNLCLSDLTGNAGEQPSGGPDEGPESGLCYFSHGPGAHHPQSPVPHPAPPPTDYGVSQPAVRPPGKHSGQALCYDSCVGPELKKC